MKFWIIVLLFFVVVVASTFVEKHTLSAAINYTYYKLHHTNFNKVKNTVYASNNSYIKNNSLLWEKATPKIKNRNNDTLKKALLSDLSYALKNTPNKCQMSQFILMKELSKSKYSYIPKRTKNQIKKAKHYCQI